MPIDSNKEVDCFNLVFYSIGVYAPIMLDEVLGEVPGIALGSGGGHRGPGTDLALRHGDASAPRSGRDGLGAVDDPGLGAVVVAPIIPTHAKAT